MQFVRSHDVVSSVRYASAGAPQGTVLSHVLFTVYTDDCRGSEECPVVKCSDDTAITHLSNSHKSFTNSVYRFSEWCSDNHLDLNVLKTKEMIIDFRRNSAVLPKLSINGTDVNRVEEYKYLGTILDNKLNFTANTKFIYRKCQSRLYCLFKLDCRRKHNDIKGLLPQQYRIGSKLLVFSMVLVD